MRVWIDISNSPQVPFFRPLIALLGARGHDVEVTTRDYAQTLELLDSTGSGMPRSGHATAARGRWERDARWRGACERCGASRRARDFDLALSHASHELPLVARSLGIPSAYAFDYEFARAQHGLGCRAARRVVVPEAIPQDRLDRLGASSFEGPQVRGAEGGVLPPRVRAGRRRPRRARTRPRPRARGRPHATRGLSLPPAREPAVRGRRCSGSAAIPAYRRSSCRARPSSERRSRISGFRRSSCREPRSTLRVSLRSRISSSRPEGR